MDTFEKIIQLSEERLITPSGLFLVGQLLGKSRFIVSQQNKPPAMPV